MRKLVAAAAAVALLLAPAAPAEAFEPADLDAAIAVAGEIWPESPCYARERVVWVSAGQVDAVGGVAVGMGGLAWGERCEAWIALERHNSIIDVCGSLAHEFGHLAGLPHTAEPTSIMLGMPYGGRGPDAHQCVDHFTADPRPAPPARGAPRPLPPEPEGEWELVIEDLEVGPEEPLPEVMRCAKRALRNASPRRRRACRRAARARARRARRSATA